MCFGNAGRQEEHARAEAQRRQDEANRQAAAKQAELERLAREREALAAQQQAEMQRLAAEQQQAEAQQQQQAATLQNEQGQRLAGINARGQSVTQSLAILSRQPATQGPTAAVDTEQRGQRSAAKTTQASLRMGSGSYGAGSGANISV